MPKFTYLAQSYKQHPDSKGTVVSFVAKAKEIIDWAGIPRKSADLSKDGTLIGFQRALDQDRVDEINKFFKEPDNISPTAIVVAFRKDFKSCRIEDAVMTSKTGIDDNVKLVLLTIEYEDFSNSSTSNLINKFIDNMSKRVDTDDLKKTSDTKNSSWEDNESLDEDGFQKHDSHLKKFLSILKSYKNKLDNNEPLPNSITEENIRDTVESMLLPAMLVDGQHRVMGAMKNNENTLFGICGLIDASWEEQVFQFVVINQKASRIELPFLNAIIASSLTQQEVDELENRLMESDIKVDVAQIMDQINNDSDSPFYEMIQFNVIGEQAKMPWTGMRTLILNFRNLKTPNSTRSGIDKLVLDICDGNTNSEKKEDWKKKKWPGYFFGFWHVIRSKYGTIDSKELPLWDTIKNPKSQLLRIATLQTLQNMFIEWCLDSRNVFPKEMDEFKKLVEKWIEPIPIELFREEWTGVISLPRDGKEKLRDTLKEILAYSNPDWRETRLFKEK